MTILDFKRIPVPNIFQDVFQSQTAFIIHYLINLNGKPFKHGKVFKDKQAVLDFCEVHKITEEKLKEAWKNGKINQNT